MQIKIRTHRVIHNHALVLCALLREMGHDASVVDEVDPDDDTLYIVYVAFSTPAPRRFILFQTEIYGNHWWSDAYRDKCRRALQIWDYSADNLRQYDFGNPKFLIQPWEWNVGPLPEKDIDLLFYGYINHRRRPLLDAVKRRSNVPLTIVEDSYGADIIELLKRTKVVLNIHAQDNSPMEVFRFAEALSCGCRVLSEGYSPDNASGRIRYLKSMMHWNDHIIRGWDDPVAISHYMPDRDLIALALIDPEHCI